MQSALLGSFGDQFEAALGPRSSSSECLRRFCMFRMADCGLRRIAALTGSGRIADCTLGLISLRFARMVGH
eukprot:1026955-Alexandrium_andersonii.AAC.1